jgi:cytoskeleton protein RodZ
VITYRGPAWTEVRDVNGQRLLLVTGASGSKETVSGTPPFELTLGNASNATISWRGAAFDLAPHVKGNVARVRLP